MFKEVWTVPLDNGKSLGVLLANKGPVSLPFIVTWSMLGLKEDTRVHVRDLWSHEDWILPRKNELTSIVGSHNVVALKLTFL